MIESVKIQSIRVDGSEPGPHLLIQGGVHGDEFAPMAAIRRLAQCAKEVSLRGTLTLVPVLNESAFERGTREGADGLDLARTFPGHPDGSPTERLAFQASQLIREADYLIDLHIGTTILDVLPLAGYTLHENPSVLAAQRKMAHAFNLPIVWGTTPTLQGRTLSVARDAQVPAIYSEHRGSSAMRSEATTAYVNGCLNVMAVLGMIDRPPPSNAVAISIEDPRPESGHLQVGYPAPFLGFFQPAAALGDRVRPGDLLGTVADILGEREEKIFCRQSGIVLVLRTFPRVVAGENLAVVLETDPS